MLTTLDRASHVLALAALGAMITLSGCSRGEDEAVVSGSMGARLDEYMTAITPYGFSGALLVAKDGKVVLKKGYGMADEAAGTPNSPSTVFTTGSITKQFTAAAILQLEMDGSLSIDDRLADHLEGVPEDKSGVTLHHLLTHTSGVTGSTGDDFEEVGRDLMVQRAMAAPLEFEPGTRMSYSNAGYSLLAAVVEVVSGQPYEQYLMERLLAPSGMRHTGYRLPVWEPGTVAHWYDGDVDNGTLLEKPYPYWNLIGNGGILSTPGDMFRWYEALKGDVVLSAEAKRKLWTPFLNDYACGWDVFETPRGLLVQHDGGSDLGASAELRWFVDEDLVTMIFCNRNFNGAPLFAVVRDEIEQLTFGGEAVLPPAPVEVPFDRLDKLAGNYRFRSGGGISVSRAGGMLVLTTYDQDVVNALFAPDLDPHAYEDLNKRSNMLVAAAVSGDGGAFVRELGDEERAERVQGMLTGDIREFFEGAGSPPIAVASLGTVPMDDEGTVMTSVRVRNSTGDKYDMSFWWREGRLVGLDQQAFQIVIPLAPVTETSFVGYHLGFARLNPVSFQTRADGSAVSMTIGGRIAERMGGMEHGHGHEHAESGERGRG